MKKINNLIKELTCRSGTGEDLIDERVRALRTLNLSDVVIEKALDKAWSWTPVFIDNHIERVEDLLQDLETNH